MVIYRGNVPIRELVEYIIESNYVLLTKRLSDLVKSVHRSGDAEVLENAERFSEGDMPAHSGNY